MTDDYRDFTFPCLAVSVTLVKPTGEALDTQAVLGELQSWALERGYDTRALKAHQETMVDRFSVPPGFAMVPLDDVMGQAEREKRAAKVAEVQPTPPGPTRRGLFGRRNRR